MWKVYILYSEKFKRTYVGCTGDMDSRIEYHNSRKVPSTKNFVPWKIVYTENVSSQAEALKREKYFKSGAGRRKMKIIFDELGINTETCPSG